MQLAFAAPDLVISHNLVGQRLGRKGQETRERIIAAMFCLLDRPGGGQITLSGVAREASVGMTTLYLYFPDIGDVLLAVLARVMEGADAAFVDRLRKRWPDDELRERCRDFLDAHLRFWEQNARVMHMQNSYADANDVRLLEYRHRMSLPLIDLMVQQMDGCPAVEPDSRTGLAMVLLAGLERLASIVTNRNFRMLATDPCQREGIVDRLIAAEARLLELAIRDQRAAAKAH